MYVVVMKLWIAQSSPTDELIPNKMSAFQAFTFYLSQVWLIFNEKNTDLAWWDNCLKKKSEPCLSDIVLYVKKGFSSKAY